jgi:choline-sulfatase
MTGTDASPDPDRPNVLVLLASGHGSRFGGYHDGPRAEPVRTPALDDLAARGTSFATACTPIPVAAPARIATLTGRSPIDIGVWDDRSTLPADVLTIATRFGMSGYRTCLVGSLGIAGDRQFAGFDDRPYGDFTGTGGRQFDPLTELMSRGSPNNAASSATGGKYGHYYDPLSRERRRPDNWRGLAGDAGETTIPESRHQERTVVREAMSWLRETTYEHPEDPWLLVTSFARPQPPLTAPGRHLDRYSPIGDGAVTDPAADRDGDAASHPLVAAKADADRTSAFGKTIDLDGESVRHARAAYFASVSYLDEIVGDLLAAVERDGQLENTIVVYVSDRGNLAGEHGLWWSGSFHEGGIRVPIIVQTPGHRRGEQPVAGFETPISLLDLAPTLYGLTGVDGPETDGVDLSAAIRTGSAPERGPVSIDFPLPRYGAGTEFRAVRTEEWKYVHFRDAPDLAFDLTADPHETTTRVTGDVPADIRSRAKAVDFAELSTQRVRDRDENRSLYINDGTAGNAYLLDDGRLLDADVTLYKPDILASHASEVFADYPDTDTERDR